MTRLRHALLLIALLSSFSAFAQKDWTREEPLLEMDAGMLLINEVLFDPPSGGADYVELYNTTNEWLPCDSFCVVRWIGDSLGRRHPLPAGEEIAPHAYIVLTTDTAFVASHYTVAHPEWLMQMESMPPFPNKEGTVIVMATNGKQQDRFDYTKDMQSPLLCNVEGVALERSSIFYSANTHGNWHSASSASGYGTPTSINSQQQQYSPFVGVELLNEVFSPDGDDYQDYLEIYYSSETPALTGNIAIYTPQGRLVRHLLRNGILGTQEVIRWDGRDDTGTLCPRGSYIIVVDIYNATGHHESKRLAASLIR